jgi:D-alanine--poly(phosphoribitol) ligase subunit 2
MNTAVSDSVTRVHALLVELLPHDSIELDTPLIASGVLDSFALIELLAAIEEEFGIQLPLDDLDLDVLRSIDSIASYVDRLQSE